MRHAAIQLGVRLTLAACLVAAVWGCAGREALRDGRAALAADNPIAAARHFEMALAQRPSLARDDRFNAQLRAARRDAAMTRGREFHDGRRYDQAIAQFERALEVEPGYNPAAAALARVHADAADAHHLAARDAADRGDLDAARAALREALAHGPDHAAAARALRLLDDPDGGRPDAVAAWRQGGTLAGVNDWDRAAVSLRAAVAEDPDLLVARAALAGAAEAITQAEARLAAGRGHLDASRFDAALVDLAEAARIRPHHVETASLLTTAQRRRAEAQRVVDDAAAALANGEFDLALATLDRARGLYPDHPELTGLEEQTRDRAAATHTARGDALLADGRADEAAAAFADAMRYRDRHEPARAGMAAIATARAAAAEADGWWGSGLLFRLDAVDWHDTPTHRAAVARARDRVIDRAGAAIALRPAAARGRSEQAALDARVERALRERSRGYVRPVDGRNGEEPDFTASVAITQFDVRHAIAGRSQRSHPYQIENPIPNPHRPHLRDAAWAARREADRARHAVRDRRDAYRHAADHAAFHVHSEDAQRKLRNRRDELDDARDELDRHERELQRIEHELARTPRMVIEVIDASWPYVVETHEVRGTLFAQATLEHVATGGQLPAATIEAVYGEADDTIIGANPALGLREDGLSLPSDASVRERLLDEAADRASAAIRGRVLEARLEDADRRARDAAEQNQPTLALEAEVDAALLLEALDPDAGRQRLASLREASAP